MPNFAPYFDDRFHKYIDVLTGIGGNAYIVANYEAIIRRLENVFAGVKRVVSFERSFSAITEMLELTNDPHGFEYLDVCIVSSLPAVAENRVIWLSDKEMPVRVLPFIAQSFVVIIQKITS